MMNRSTFAKWILIAGSTAVVTGCIPDPNFPAETNNEKAWGVNALDRFRKSPSAGPSNLSKAELEAQGIAPQASPAAAAPGHH